MKFEIKHLLLLTAIVAVGLTFTDQLSFQFYYLAGVHLFFWWLAGLEYLNPRFRGLPISIISIAVTVFAVSVVYPATHYSSLKEVSRIAVVVLLFRIFLVRPLTENSRLILGYSILVSTAATLLTTFLGGDEIHFTVMWLLATVCVGLIHLKLGPYRTKRIGWLDRTASILMWGGLIGIVLATITICALLIINYQNPDLGNLVAGFVAYLVGAASWMAVSVGVATNLIADPDPPLFKTGKFQFLCILAVAVQLSFQAYFYQFFLH